MRPWYYLPGFLVYSVCFFESRPSSAEVVFKFARFCLIAAACGFVGFLAYKKHAFRDEVSKSMEFIEGIGDHVPEGEAVFQVDGSGYVGFYAPRAIVNGDGLMNTHEYARLLVSGELEVEQYLRENGICYVIANKSAQPGFIVSEHGLGIREEAVELLMAREGDMKYRFTKFKLFRLNACQEAPSDPSNVDGGKKSARTVSVT